MIGTWKKIEKAEIFRNAYLYPTEACHTKSLKIPSVETSLDAKFKMAALSGANNS